MWNLMASRAAAMLVVLCTAVPGQVVGATHGAKATVSDCLINLAAVRSPLRFADFPAVADSPLEHWRGPLLTSANAREFRTMLQKSSLELPNFAGHYTIAVWGCGSSCTDFGIIDRHSGRFFFDRRLRGISGVYVGSEPDGVQPAFNSLRFERDSRLLVVLGAPNEDESRDGVTFLRWTGETLLQLRFVHRDQACMPSP
jgi:hypothetical protein